MAPPRALYVHVPFCTRVCPYCAFTVTSRFDDGIVDRFLDAIGIELGSISGGRPLDLETVYIGGGTPTAVSPAQLARLLAIVRNACKPDAIREWTVEMNPEDATSEKARILRDAGVTRVSIGAQSMNERFLKALGRSHSAVDVRKSVELFRNQGFPDLNVDLIYAQQNQSLDDWTQDVDAVLALPVDHLSLYELTFEPETPFGKKLAKGVMSRVEDVLAVEMFWAAYERMQRSGLDWYEVSNFAKPGHESIHNQVYWRNEPYYGVGPGAFACVDGTRTTNATDVAEWRLRVESHGTGVVEKDVLTAKDTFIESLAAGLRTRVGVDLQDLRRRTGLDPATTHGAWVADLVSKGLAEIDPDRLRLTLRGVLVLDSILLGFLDVPERASGRPQGVA